jgi:hypothetical protein
MPDESANDQARIALERRAFALAREEKFDEAVAAMLEAIKLSEQHLRRSINLNTLVNLYACQGNTTAAEEADAQLTQLWIRWAAEDGARLFQVVGEEREIVKRGGTLTVQEIHPDGSLGPPLRVFISHFTTLNPASEEVQQADMIICCRPDLLDEEMRRKHIFPDIASDVVSRMVSVRRKVFRSAPARD